MKKPIALYVVVPLSCLCVFVGYALGVYSSRMRTMPIAPIDFKATIESIQNEDYLCVSAEYRNHFADFQFPGYTVEPDRITVGYYWKSLFPFPMQTIHADWPLLIGPLNENANGTEIFLEGYTNSLGILKKNKNWVFELHNGTTRANQGTQGANEK